MSHPDARTRLVGVVGHPVAHSLSPAIHNAALRHDGVNAVYVAFDVDDGSFEVAMDGLRAVGALGVNVTVPHKERALDYADGASEEALRVGAANVLVFAGGSVEAHNSDADAFRRAARELVGSLDGDRVLLLGAGGAARAAAFALEPSRLGALLVANRTSARANALSADLAAGSAQVVPWSQVADAAGDVGFIVNATSIGLDPGGSPLPPEVLARAAAGGCRGVLDLVYAPGSTRLVLEARAAGIPAEDGLSALVYQAAAAYELFCGRAAPVSLMLDAAASAAGRTSPRDPGKRDIPMV